MDAARSYIAASKRILADVAEAERAASDEYTTVRGRERVGPCNTRPHVSTAGSGGVSGDVSGG